MIDCLHFPRILVRLFEARRSKTDRARQVTGLESGGACLEEGVVVCHAWRRDARTRVSPETVSHRPSLSPPPQNRWISATRNISPDTPLGSSNSTFLLLLLPLLVSTKREKSMIFDRFPGQRGVVLSWRRGLSRCGGMNFIYIKEREREAKKFSGSHSRELEAARLKLRPLIDGG